MGIGQKKSLQRAVILIAVLLVGGCERPNAVMDETLLVRVEKQVCTISDFNRAYDVARAAYEEKEVLDPDIVQEIRERVLREYIEELILLERAQELNLKISDRELQMEIYKIKKDYPEDSFEEMLLERSISYSYWKERLRKKLLKDRLETVELEKDISVNATDIKEFHDRYLVDTPRKPDSETDAAAFSRRIIRQVRKEKAKENYPEWMRSLQKRYRITVNQNAWKKIEGY